MSLGLLRDMNHLRTRSRQSLALCNFSECRTQLYINGSVETGLLVIFRLSMASEANVTFLSEEAIWRWVGLRKCMKPYTLLTQSLNSRLYSESSPSSPSCWGHCESPSGPCRVPGTWTRVKWNRRIETIQRLMLADGTMSGFNNIPLIYHTSTSTIRFWMPIRYIFSKCSAWKRL